MPKCTLSPLNKAKLILFLIMWPQDQFYLKRTHDFVYIHMSKLYQTQLVKTIKLLQNNSTKSNIKS